MIAGVEAAVALLQGRDDVDGERLGITGFCVGGRVVYLMAAAIVAPISLSARGQDDPAPASSGWTQFRGPQASGVATGGATPTRWDVATGANILWKTPIPGLGHASPIVWGDRVYVTTAVGARSAKRRTQ